MGTMWTGLMRGSLAAMMAAACSSHAARLTLIHVAALDPASDLSLNNCSAQLARDDGVSCLDVRFGHDTEWPNIRFDLGRSYTRSNWSEAAVLVMDVENRSAGPEKINIRVDDSSAADGRQHCRQGGVVLEPGRRADVQFDVGMRQIPGMRGQPRGRGLDKSSGVWIADNGRPIDTGHIVAFQIFRAKPDDDATLRIHGIWLETRSTADDIEPFVDRFGQFADESWPGKLLQDSEFSIRRDVEAKDLEAHPPPTSQNRFGGWRAGPSLEATGRFRVIKRHDKWWFVDPEGCLFWSAGITGLRPASGGPMLGRERYFSWLPAEGDPLRRFYRTEGRGWIDFFAMNLQRKYGEDFEQAFAEISARRLRSWGLNSVGNWSDARVWKLGKVPYTIPVHYSCPSIPVWTRRSFPDVFSPAFESALRQKLESLAAYNDDPWLLGVFIDNELPWAGWGADQASLLPLGFLNSDEPTETGRTLVRDLKDTYGTVEALNAAWGTETTGWDDVADGLDLTQNQREKARADLSAMSIRIARRYFETCRRLMDELMPGCLYMGPRFASHNRESVAVATEFCDVVCFNMYAELPTEGGRAALIRDLDIPVLIGEYHFGALDSGMFHTGLRKARNQQERAEKFATYLKTALREPWCVGAHWFQFRDQPLTGRFDGENYNIGFVTITDTPYPLMREAARQVTATMYEWRKSP